MRIEAATNPDAFIDYTGWQFNSEADRKNFRVAFQFLQQQGSRWVRGPGNLGLNELDDSSPWTPGGPHVRRTVGISILQAINMSFPVEVVALRAGLLIKQFRWMNEPAKRPGSWFTSLHGSADSLGIPQGQCVAHTWRVTRRIDAALKSTVGDAFTGWNRVTPPTAGSPFADYRRGGGAQWLVPPSPNWSDQLARA
ncbi:MAG: hypothetical protein ACI841_001218 [Planctomycetota bacterium]|jgi:hypothetical protein